MTNKKPPIDYHKLSDELDKIVNDLQTGDLDVDRAVNLYERGNAIVAKLQDYLKDTKNRINKVRVSAPPRDD